MELIYHPIIIDLTRTDAVIFLATTSVPGGSCVERLSCSSLGKLSKYQITYIVSNPTTLMFVEKAVYLEMSQLVGLETIQLFPSNDWGFSPIESCPLCTFLGFSVLPPKKLHSKNASLQTKMNLRFPFGFDLVCTQVIQVDTSETREALLVFVGEEINIATPTRVLHWIMNSMKRSWQTAKATQHATTKGARCLQAQVTGRILAALELGIKVPNLAYNNAII